jgi:iron complex transport system permease protein
MSDWRGLEADLARAVSGEVRFDAGARAAYSADASNYRQVPIVDGRVLAGPLRVEYWNGTEAVGAPVLARGGGTPRLLLTGVVVAAGAGSIVSLLLALSDDSRLRGMVFWLLGDLSRAERWQWLAGLLLVAALASVALGRHLNVLARGETQAATLGLDVRRLRITVFVLSSLLTGCAVSAAGSIGFVGLVTPHLVRLALGADNRVVLPASALLGGILLMAADLGSRVLLAPRQLPVGALTAVVGVPIFLLLMSRQRN